MFTELLVSDHTIILQQLTKVYTLILQHFNSNEVNEVKYKAAHGQGCSLHEMQVYVV